MDEETKELLEQEIRREIQELLLFEPGSMERSRAIDDVAKLCRLNIEETKMELDCSERIETRINEEQAKLSQTKERKFDRFIRLGLDTIGVILPLGFYNRWMKKGFKFEETGTFTSTTFRGLFNRFRPTK